MNKKQQDNSIYEKEGVFGDFNKYKEASHRLIKIMKIIQELDFSGGRVLDVGCGTGYLAAQIKKISPKAEVYGADISKNAITLGRSLYKDIKFTVSDSEKKFPYRDNFFDLIVSGEHIAHLKYTDVYLSEISRVMKKGGVLILSTPNLVSWLNRILVLTGKAPFFFEPLLVTGVPVVSFLGKEFPDREMLPSGHLRLFNLDMLRKSLEIYGIKIIGIQGVSSLNNKLIKKIDMLFSTVPDLASGIVVIGKKE